jgi:hypothetical protein
LRKICSVSRCKELASIVIHAGVEKLRTLLEYWAFDESLSEIGNGAFAKCNFLVSFDVPGGVKSIGRNCFAKCPVLYRLRFGSSESLRRIVGDPTLSQAVVHL